MPNISYVCRRRRLKLVPRGIGGYPAPRDYIKGLVLDMYIKAMSERKENFSTRSCRLNPSLVTQKIKRWPTSSDRFGRCVLGLVIGQGFYGFV
ncbi:hypothetical protein CEXT_782101 [Caerostris extrusa]|uniref:Uncharacterized protein n=1 Tax=Caerostris extrusa TaxID=172846 RepID=A0AAV4WU51_CAEEX|nr:hypothetical protein CEXT_782101 [Caerostris extrusa]